MHTPEKIKAGIERYVREDIIPKLEGSGWKVFAVSAAIGSILPMINKEMDIDTLYATIRAQMEKQGHLTLTAADMRDMHPVIGTIAGSIFPSVTFTVEDVDKLYSYMQ